MVEFLNSQRSFETFHVVEILEYQIRNMTFANAKKTTTYRIIVRNSNKETGSK